MALSPELWALIGVVATGSLSWWGKRLESAGARAIASQGAAADEWKELATFHRDRADRAEAKLSEQDQVHDDVVADLRRQIAGLEARLVDVGEDVRGPGDRL